MQNYLLNFEKFVIFNTVWESKVGVSIKYSPKMDGGERRCNIGEVSSLHILVVGNVITVRLQEGDYGNPFVPIYARVGEW